MSDEIKYGKDFFMDINKVISGSKTTIINKKNMISNLNKTATNVWLGSGGSNFSSNTNDINKNLKDILENMDKIVKDIKYVETAFID
ncbi:MAG: hypothetical protein ACRDDY_16820, partial [Clostridium sp.]|uniref:hypothetical protein n=1 Tax=Clostridium sp. TaxID=1506 RepID=UPI003EE66001